MKKTTKFLFFAVAILFSAAVFAQSTVTGTIVDADLKSPLPGANIIEKGTTNGTSSDFDGNFSLTTTATSGTLVVSYVGYGTITLTFNGDTNLGQVTLTSDNTLDEIVIIGTGVVDLAEDRKTPIAVSTIKAKEIQQKIGTSDVTATLVNTPSVYVAGQAGGFGDSRIAVRGFGQDNTAFLLNGQPINGMEDGLMYWSNWSGMSDIANAIQIQRGLGSSKLAISSVGGTVNFVTKATDKREGGFVQSTVANNNYFKGTVGYSSGLLENGWGVTAMLTHWQGDGYNFGTYGQGQNYFLSIGYKANDKHSFNFLITGAPQWHDQNFTKSISDYLTHGRKYNNNWGTYKGQYMSERRNFYHKPVANLNWDFNISDKTSLSTVLYASWGRGGGTGNYGSRVRTDDGQVDFDAIAANNAAANGEGMFGNSTYVIRSSMNMHQWYGLVTNLETKLSENLTLNAGLDLRTYYGIHYRQVENFLGLNSWTESRGLRGADNQIVPGSEVSNTVTEDMAANPWTATFNTMPEDQRIDYDYSERISYGGVFAQLEYATDKFSAFFQGAASTQGHQRFDRYDYLPEFEDSEKVNNTGFNLKGGGSYFINDDNAFYVNVGYYDRQPYHDNVYLNYTNEVNPLTSNEKIFGIEAGYSFKSEFITANLNVYRTSWKDRVEGSSRVLQEDTTIGGFDQLAGDIIFTTNQGAEQLHTGVELDVVAKPFSKLRVNGFLSVGNWEYKGDVITRQYNEDRDLLTEEEEDVDGGKVGDAAQFTAGIGANYEILERFSIDADWRTYDKLYANVGAVKENLELPTYDVVDLGLSYKMLTGVKSSLDFRFNVNNVFDEVYLSELRSNIQAEAGDETWNGINVANQGFYGLGRTWNFSMKFNF
ncbi:MAG: carboxypeptidase-like regulatory domain-containing protein [Flavobacteriaceae bacterium]|nr:carboxypeptidase-like regulatory domain-containing protein [Mangrovimonas sp.]MCB0475831.1 carboxypeptidase-like regulatory domain-containing protein [Flavobacteriaceae bacterium]